MKTTKTKFYLSAHPLPNPLIRTRSFPINIRKPFQKSFWLFYKTSKMTPFSAASALQPQPARRAFERRWTAKEKSFCRVTAPSTRSEDIRPARMASSRRLPDGTPTLWMIGARQRTTSSIYAFIFCVSGSRML